MNTFDLSKKINNDLILKQCFIGLFPIDLAQKIVKYPSALLLNLDNSSSPTWLTLGSFLLYNRRV